MTARRGLTNLAAAACAAGGALVIAVLQPALASDVHKVRQRDDVFLLPPPAELRAMTLGYRNAAADLLWAKLILEYGLHHQERRAFPDIYRYIDGIIAIEPDHPTLYQFIDTLILFAPTPAGPEEARRARAYLERGTKERPYDHDVWLHYGQYLAFFAPSFLTDEAEIDQWRKDGAFAIAHAVEIGADPGRSLSATTILSKAGERTWSIQHLQRIYALTDDPHMREQILLKLKKLEATPVAEDAVTAVETELRTRYPMLSRTGALLVGPHRSAAACAGPASYDRKRCPRDWSGVVEGTR